MGKSSLEIRVVRQIDETRWKEFVDRAPQGNIFHAPEMFQVFSRTRGYRPELWAALRQNDDVLALMIPVEIRLGRLLPRLTNRAIVYGSVLVTPEPESAQGLEQLLSAYLAITGNSMLFTELRNLSDLKAIQPVLKQFGFTYEDHLNYLIDLNRSADEVFQSIGKRTRKNIRHGLNRGRVSVEELTDRTQVGACYDLIRQTYRRARVPLADKSLFEAAFDVLYPRRMARFTLARVDSVPAATSVELIYKEVIYGWYSGMDRAFSEYVPNELLMWNILDWGARSGYKVYDFGGAGKPDEVFSVRDFKAKFGGELVCYGRNTRVHTSFVLAISKLGYRILRKLPILVDRQGRVPIQPAETKS